MQSEGGPSVENRTSKKTGNTSIQDFQEYKSIVIRFAGDSGDGIQTIGEQFTDSSAIAGNDIATLPDFPAEIRAPAGSLAGVSGFQIQFGSGGILTPGDAPDALVAMNPAALKANLPDLAEGGILVLNTDTFTESNLEKAGYDTDPLVDEKLQDRYETIKINITELTKEALAKTTLTAVSKTRFKNFFALGFVFWVYDRPPEPTLKFFQDKWGKKKPELAEAGALALKAGYYFGETTEISRNRYMVAKASVKPGLYRKISGNQAMVLGFLSSAHAAKRPIVYAGYPITPASPILEGLAFYKNFGIKTVQAEDEIAAVGMALGASFAGSIGITATSGPGLCLKSEFIGLAVTVELPLVICNVQRGGPSTGLPTKTEQGDLLQSMYGRNSDSPVPIIAASSPSDCFNAAIEAVRIATTYKTPVILLSDLYIANGSEPWRVPQIETLPDISVPDPDPSQKYVTYQRDPQTLARKQAVPGQPGLEHRIGGLEKDERGQVSYDPNNHEQMTKLRAAKVQAIAQSLPPLKIRGEAKGDLLVIGWGGTYGAITSAVAALQEEGYAVSNIHLRHINPFPNDLGDIIKNFKTILIPELNLGQLSLLIRSRYAVEVLPFNKVQGQPFTVKEIRNKIAELLAQK